MTPFNHTTRHQQIGLSLIELMVAMVIGLIVSLAIFQVLESYEGRKRSITSVNDINQAGNFASFVLDKLIRSAGSGITQGDGASLGCLLNAAKNGATILPSGNLPTPFSVVNTAVNNNFRLIPLLIVPAAGPNSSDALIIMGGNAGYGEVATSLAATPETAKLTLNNTLGFSTNDLILLSKRGNLSSCLLTQVSSVNSTNSQITLGGAYNNSSVNVTNFPYVKTNPNASAIVSNLGNISSNNPPSFVVVGVGDQNTLFGYDLLQSQNPTDQVSYPIADGIWAMYARYGLDEQNNGNITWTKAEGAYSPINLTTQNTISRIKAVRIGLVMRTSLSEKSEVNASDMELFSDLGESLKEKVTPDDRHYRYRVIDTTIPLPNMLGITGS